MIPFPSGDFQNKENTHTQGGGVEGERMRGHGIEEKTEPISYKPQTKSFRGYSGGWHSGKRLQKKSPHIARLVFTGNSQ